MAFFYSWGFGLLKLFMAKFGLFHFFGPGNPDWNVFSHLKLLCLPLSSQKLIGSKPIFYFTHFDLCFSNYLRVTEVKVVIQDNRKNWIEFSQTSFSITHIIESCTKALRWGPAKDGISRTFCFREFWNSSVFKVWKFFRNIRSFWTPKNFTS